VGYCYSLLVVVRGTDNRRALRILRSNPTAQRTQVILIDDLIDEQLPDAQGQTVSFGLDGIS